LRVDRGLVRGGSRIEVVTDRSNDAGVERLRAVLAEEEKR
jgi:hypothetical protein